MFNTKQHIEAAPERGMWLKQKAKQIIAIALLAILFFYGPVQAQRYMERLGRGVVAVYQGGGEAGGDYRFGWGNFGYGD